MDVSALVAVLDEALHIEQSARRILGQDFQGRLEVLFLDGGSTDGTLGVLCALAAEDPRVRIIDNPRRTQVAALNLGLREAGGEVIVQMDAHTLYPPDHIRLGVERLARGDYGWVSGPPIPHGVDAGSQRTALALGSRFGTGGADKWRARGEVELDTGVFAGFWRRETLERLGGWDEGWPVNHDGELAARHLAAGGRIICAPQLGSRYVPRSTLLGLWKQYRGYGLYRVRTIRRHPQTMRPSHVLSAGPGFAALAALLPGALGRPARAVLGVYVVAAVAAAVEVAHRTGARREALGLPATFAAMHFGWGFGFIAGVRRFGFPGRGMALVAVKLARRVSRPGDAPAGRS